MRTFAFCSYKRGIGRSRFLATAARFLASRGQNVVALDLDLVAPDLHYKLEVVDRAGEGDEVGVVPYLLASSQSEVPPLSLKSIDVSGELGRIVLIPAGPAPDPLYWRLLARLEERMRSGSTGGWLAGLLDLKARVETELAPDVLLLDLGAGVTALGGLATLLADTVVCMTGQEPEDIDGISAMVDGLLGAPRLADQDRLRIVPLVEMVDEPGLSAPEEKLMWLAAKAQGTQLVFFRSHKHGGLVGSLSNLSVDGLSPAHEIDPLTQIFGGDPGLPGKTSP